MKYLPLLLLLAGCAGQSDYYKALEAKFKADAVVKEGEYKVAVEQKKAEAVAMQKMGAEGAAAYGVASVLAEAIRGIKQQPESTVIQPPKSAADYILGTLAELRGWVRDAGPVVLGIRQSKDNVTIAQSRDSRDVELEKARQGGETARIGAIAGKPGTVTNYNAGGDIVGGSSDRRNCTANAGAGAAGASGGSATATTGSGTTAGSGASGGSGGNASANCP